MTMKKIIFHIDVNSAYLSWTAIKLLRDGSNTDLRKIPAIVGGDMSKRHGVVLAKSMSAARYGIRTGEPITDALRKCASLTIVHRNIIITVYAVTSFLTCCIIIHHPSASTALMNALQNMCRFPEITAIL